ncbi:MAG TPA: Wzt carbohydrate-binding domain-containing protein, partial [Candidatus Methanoperedens sp.]|nr:Wzt carbohydrate-binding domain-containing protein [Candidatus Methanoperedens sp.]
PEILIVDEVLSVGDERFREKCRGRIGELHRRGRTFLIVSHDMDTIQAVCDRVLVLDRGEAVLEAAPGRAVNEYHAINAAGAGEGPAAREWGSREAEIVGVDLRAQDGGELAALGAGAGFTALVRWRAARRLEDPVFGFALSDADGKVLYGTNTLIDGFPIPALEGSGEIALEIAPLPFLRGRYYLTFAIHSRDHRTFHRLDNCRAVSVTPDGEHAGTVRLAARWRLPG